MPPDKKSHYFTGGFAEITPDPSPLTYTYLSDWFTGSKWIGKAMDILHLPCEKINLPILEMINDELVINLVNEEKTLYKKTLFSYKTQRSESNIPVLMFDTKKLLCLPCIVNTFKIIYTQSTWIANPEKAVDNIQNNIDAFTNATDDSIWGAVVATGFLSEFYNQLLIKETGGNMTDIQLYIDVIVKEKDWFFKSYSDQAKVNSGSMSFSSYMDEYGLRADRDYELTCPRWWEIPDIIKKRINNSVNHKNNQNHNAPTDIKIKKYIDAFVRLQILRSDVKKKVLVYMNKLRQDLLKKSPEKFITKSAKTKRVIPILLKQGKGRGVSPGIVEGTVQIINHVDNKILADSICIFPNASPEFAIQFPKCKGIIFLKGGSTSHGAIVAREYDIPALIEESVINVSNGTKIKIDGKTGIWSLC